MMHGTPPRLPAFRPAALRQRPAPRPTTTPAVGWLQFGVQGGQSFWGSITLTLPAGTDTVIALSTDDVNTTVPPSVTIVAGQNWARFPIQTQPLPVTATVHRYVWIRATLAGVTTRQRIVIEPAPSGEPIVTGLFAADGTTPLTHAPPGATVVILGQHFGPSRGQVVFDPAGRAAVTLWSDTRIEAQVPPIGDSVRRQSVEINLPLSPHFLPAAAAFGIDAPPARKP